ncbi:hypothetical protein ACHAXS_001439 [Conticribra weissflogii]
MFIISHHYRITSLWIAALLVSVSSFAPPIRPPRVFTLNQDIQSTQTLFLFNFGNTKTRGKANIPASTSDRDVQAISAIKSAIQKPRNPKLPLIECEFPALGALNKLGDGSLRSALEAEDANVTFLKKVVGGVASVPFMGPKVTIVLSSAASNSLMKKVQSVKGANLVSLRDRTPTARRGEVCVFLTPSSQKDYQTARTLAKEGCPTVILNGFAKDRQSIPESATMAYFLKPLTYNSQVAGFLVRSYPSLWTVLDAQTKQVLGCFTDEEILVTNTNTPDLRESGRLVQKSVDERAIRARGE